MADEPSQGRKRELFCDPCSSTNDQHGTAIPFRERLSCTVDEACAVTGLGRTKLYELIGSGQVLTTTIGRRRLVVVRSLLALIDRTISA